MSQEISRDFLALQTALAGRYSLERELGRGGMGVVYLAHEVVLDRPVALKLLPAGAAADPAVRARLLHEARTAAKLSHPNIVQIFTVDEVDGFVFFAMALVDGETLGERVRARGPLTDMAASRLMREVSWALGYAHAQGVVHRDVKPDNTEPAPPVASVAPHVPTDLARTIDRLLRKDPHRRFQDGGAVADALSRGGTVDRPLPIPLRVFIRHLREISRVTPGAVLLSVFLLLPMLFDELPKEAKRDLAELPTTLAGLEDDARTLRRRIGELDGALSELGDDPDAPGAAARDRVRVQVHETRTAAAARLEEVVTALETIRLGLLRMHAGERTLPSVTMELQTARGLATELSSHLEGHREVERILAERRLTGAFRILEADD